MKWNEFIVEQGGQTKPPAHIDHVDRSRSNSNLVSYSTFKLKSIEKALLEGPKHNLIHSRGKGENGSAGSALEKMVSRISFQTVNFCREIPKESFDGKSSKKVEQYSPSFVQMCELFNREFQSFISSFFAKYSQFRAKLSQTELLQKKIVQGIQENFSNFLRTDQNSTSKADSPIKRTTLQSEPSGIGNEQNVSFEKHYSRVIKFKNDKIFQKNNFKTLPQPTRPLNDLLANNASTKTGQGEKKKFSRQGQRYKKERSIDVTVEDIIERSFNESQRSSRSKLKARQALYKFNQVLRQHPT